jgi:glycosyltransferase involved in cell wall biosynthesis
MTQASSEGPLYVKMSDRPTEPRAPLVVHVFPSFAVGGAQVRFAAVANHFGRSFRHIVVSLDGNLECRDRLRPDLDAIFPVVDAPKGAMFANARRFRRLLKDWRPDVLVTGNWGAIEFAMANIPPVTRHIHIVDGFGPEERAVQIPRRVWVNRLVLARSEIVLPSRNLVRIATEVWRLNPKRVRYVPNGIDLTRFAAPDRAERSDVPTIGTIAALREEKNLGRLLRAFAIAASRTPGRLTIVGDGAERPGLTTLAAELGVADRVLFTGHRDDTPALYAGFDVFALSSDTEQMPLSLIEAMACGLPAASTDVGDVRSMLPQEQGGFVVPLSDEALAEALTALLRDRALRLRLGAANLAKATRDFADTAMFERYRALWTGS